MSTVDVAWGRIHGETVHSPGCFKDLLDLPSSKSIEIYVTAGGSSTPMVVMESDSIASVKLRIQSCRGFAAKNQKLVFEGRELSRTRCLVKECGIRNGNVLHLALRVSDLLLIKVRTVCGKEFELRVDRHRNVGYLKRRIVKNLDFTDPEVFCEGEELEEDRLIHDIADHNDAVLHLAVQRSAKVSSERELDLSIVDNRVDFYLEPIIVNPQVKLPPFLSKMVEAVSEGLARGKQPIRSSEGTGGTYFMQDGTGDKYIAVFKPTDEEPLAVNNPQGLPPSLTGEGLKRGTRVGEGAWREVAAYILDHPYQGGGGGPQSPLHLAENGFAGVPPTMMVHCLHEGFNHPEGFDCSSENGKTGSLQMFRKNDGSCEEIGPRDFPVDEVHKISVLDMRLANADRHGGNILHYRDTETDQIVLIPIDHGYCLPENFEDCTFEWLYWPQARQPFSQKSLDYINSLDAEQDIATLRFYGLDLSLECARTLRISTMLLKKGAQRGFMAHAIGNMMCREKMNKKSVIEEIVEEAMDGMLPGMSEAAFLETVSEIMDATLDKLSK